MTSLLLSLILAVVLPQTPAPSSRSAPWTNPLVEQRADPHVTLHDGQYLMLATVPEYDRIELRRAPTHHE